MTKNGTITIALTAALALGLTSCQEFFTSSLAQWAERDASVPDNLTASQAMNIADTARVNRDTALAQALLPQMAGFLTGTPSNELAASAVSTAVLASGIDDAFGGALTTIGFDVIDNGGSLSTAQIDSLVALFGSVAADADALIVFNYLNTQSAADTAAAGVTAADYAMAATAVLIAEARTQGIDLAAAMDTGFAGEGFNAGTANAVLAKNLITKASAQWPGDDLLSAMTDMFDAL